MEQSFETPINLHIKTLHETFNISIEPSAKVEQLKRQVKND
jgi:2-succinyl-5-enolpyruvyl-6-hydroxy-3-cyclohexene-1-carboxylate synthase